MTTESKRYLWISLQVLAILLVATYLGFQSWNYVEAGPCDADTFPARCYLIQKKACEVVWAQSEVDCKSRIAKLSLPPTQLIGPIMQKCQQARLDQEFTYSRTSTPECATLHSELEAWLMRNPDFQ